MTWTPRLESRPGRPLYDQIARGIVADIRRGRLRAGQRLPGSRSLAALLGVHRNTINAALDALEAEGFLRTEAARGRFVSEDAAALEGKSARARQRARRRVPRRTRLTPVPCDVPLEIGEPPPNALVLSGGLPDARTFPGSLLGRAYGRVMRRGDPSLLEYGDARGLPALRRALAHMLADERGLACRADDVLITRGSQQALWLASQAMLKPGDRVAVEEFGYTPAWNALRMAGAQLCPVAVDEDGLSLDGLERLLRQGPLRAVYVTPHHQYPTLATLSAPRRSALLALAASHGFFVLEDDYDHEFHYAGRPVLPLASHDHEGVVIYMGTLSKVLAPGVRVGMAVAPPAVLERMAALRTCIDRQGDLPTEAALAELIEEGELARHVRRNRRIYAARRNAVVDALRTRLGAQVCFRVPPGGMALWLDVAKGIDVARWAERSAARGVIFSPGHRFHIAGGGVQHIRVGFARVNEGELRSAVEIMRRCLP